MRHRKRYTEFERKLATLVNSVSLEQRSDTPDYMLAKYLMACLRAYEDTTLARDQWHGGLPERKIRGRIR